MGEGWGSQRGGRTGQGKGGQGLAGGAESVTDFSAKSYDPSLTGKADLDLLDSVFAK